jgi:hypothetical protein
MITVLLTWRHFGFHVCSVNRIQPKEESAIENLARYIIRASFSQERMKYLADEGTVIYLAKDGKARKVFDAPEWLTAMCSHVTNPREQMVRYYGYYSNVTRGKRKKFAEDDAVPYITHQTGPWWRARKAGPGRFRKYIRSIRSFARNFGDPCGSSTPSRIRSSSRPF